MLINLSQPQIWRRWGKETWSIWHVTAAIGMAGVTAMMAPSNDNRSTISRRTTAMMAPSNNLSRMPNRNRRMIPLNQCRLWSLIRIALSWQFLGLQHLKSSAATLFVKKYFSIRTKTTSEYLKRRWRWRTFTRCFLEQRTQQSALLLLLTNEDRAGGLKVGDRCLKHIDLDNLWKFAGDAASQ